MNITPQNYTQLDGMLSDEQIARTITELEQTGDDGRLLADLRELRELRATDEEAV